MEVTVLREAIVNAETILRDVPENCIAAMEYFIESNPSHHNVDAVRMQMTEIRQSMLMIESAKQSIKNAADAREVLLKNIDRLHQIAIPTWTLQFSVFVTTVESSSANVASLEDAISSLVNVTNTFVNSIGNKS
jgi:hypothetical protein